MQVSFPRLKMFFIVSITGAIGFISSFVMLQYEISSMEIRYPLAIGISYFAFLILLWLWLRTSSQDYDLPDVSWNSHSSSIEPIPTGSANHSSLADAISGIAQAEEFALPIILIVIVGAVLLSALWIIYSAPSLFSELLIDSALSASLYRKLRRIESRHWLSTAIKRTFWPFLITAVLMLVAGKYMDYHYPDANTLGEVIHSQRSAAK